ncbi:MAG: protein translocase subunit SecF [Eubacteriales bacterium]
MLKFKREFKFIKYRKICYLVSILIIVITIGGGLIQGFNFGIDFTGGTMIQIDMKKQVSTENVQTIAKSVGITGDIVYAGEGNREIILRTTQSLTSADRIKFISALGKEYGTTNADVQAAEQFGPSVGSMLEQNAIKAVIIATICMLIYIAIRFEWKFGLAAVAALAHDILIVVGFYGLFQIPINAPFIASILVILGYSMNDTIVIFDRIRENLKIMKRTKLDELIDRSINQSLARSIATSVATLLSIIVLYFMGSETIKQFTLPLIVGITVGTLSSILVASPIWYEINMALDKPKYKLDKPKSKNKYKSMQAR